ncbi:hypothetical protein JXA05_04385 [Candidatus Peregrinibacteria bacterium]|nr:hypothetical protein [Candidatus Peregrinibacteria bacterium]
MKPSKIIIAAAVLIFLSSFLSGCALIPGQDTVRPAAGQEKIQALKQVKKSVSMKLFTEKIADEVKVRVVLQNPERKPIISAQSWLSYNPALLTGLKVDATDSPFALSAPYENAFDGINGVVMVGRSNNAPITDPSITIATVTFSMKTRGTAMVDVYDYKSDLSGHASANVIEEGIPYNILLKPQSPALIIQNYSKPKFAQ